jgi:uncharacterized protein
MAWSLPEDGVLGIFVDQPDRAAEGSALAAEWGRDRAAEIHEALLLDTMDFWNAPSVLNPGGRRVLVYGPADAGPWFDDVAPESFALQPRADGESGGPIRTFLAGELEEAGRVVAMVGNAPTIDPAIVVSAFVCLEGNDLVIGPSTDGGCYLIGARGELPPVLDPVEWRRADGLSRLMDRLAETGLSLAVLPPWYVVETPDQLRMLGGHLRALRRSGYNPMLPHLERLCGMLDR